MNSKRFLTVIMTVIMLISSLTFGVNADSNSGVEAFVTRMYSVCLDRQPDNGGLSYWCDKLTNKEATGTSVAYGFIFSQEFQNKNCTNEEFVQYMYSAFFGRAADPSGFNFWVSSLNNGMSREVVFAGFTNSPEFATLCANDGIVKGYYIPGYDVNQTAQVCLFVERLYNVILNRSCDTAGMEFWTKQLVSRAMSGTKVASGFVFSGEFINKNLCNSHYVDILYNAFMGRDADSAGKNYWVGLLDSGTSREVVFNGFAGSAEFKGICDSYGIDSGTTVLTSCTYAKGTCPICGTVAAPSPAPTTAPNAAPTSAPASAPNGTSTNNPTAVPTNKPTAAPTSAPATVPTNKPTAAPTAAPTSVPTATPAPTPIVTVPVPLTTNYDGTGWSWAYDPYYGDEDVYVDPATGEYLKGWQMIKGEIYYFDPSTGYMKRYFQIIDGCHYFFGKEGTLRQDTFFKMYRLTYYSHPDGQIKKGFFELDGNLYYSTYGAGGDNPPGPLALNTLFLIGGENYYFDENFTAVSGWLEFKSRWYYFDSVTKKGYKDGWYEINGKEYYFDADAICAVDCVKEFVIETNGYRYSEYYRFDKDGQIVKGWYLDESNDTWYYYDETTGEAKPGWFQYNNDWYYSYKDGRCAKEEIVMTTKGDSYVGSDYKCKYGWIPLTIDGKTYYMYANTSGYLVEDWKTINGKDYYFYSSYSEKPYTMAFNTTIDGHYINNSGVRVS